MLELTKRPHTDGRIEICAVIPASRYDAVVRAMEEAAEPDVSLAEAFPESTPGRVLCGMRGLREMTQAQLAAAIGAHKSHISEMERGKRPIGKEMAKRLGEALNTGYRIFL